MEHIERAGEDLEGLDWSQVGPCFFKGTVHQFYMGGGGLGVPVHGTVFNSEIRFTLSVLFFIDRYG